MTESDPNLPSRVTVESRGWRGEGLVSLSDERWLTVHGASPGETVDIEIVSERGKHVKSILQNRNPVEECSEFWHCSGCHIRHLTPLQERAWKLQSMQEILEKYAELRVEVSELEWIAADNATVANGVRIRGNLSPRGAALGLNGVDGSLIQVANCPALVQPAQKLIGKVEEAWASLSDAEREPFRGVEYYGNAYFQGIQLLAKGHIAKGTARGVAESMSDRLDGVSVWFAHQGRSEALDDIPWEFEVGEMRVAFGPDAWVHAVESPAHALYTHVESLLSSGTTTGGLLEIGCGVGPNTLLAAKLGYAALGIDQNRHAIAYAKANAATHKLSAQFAASHWKRAIRDQILEGAQSRTVILNPMREPIGPVLESLKRLGTKRVIYLGPSPTSAAKDLHFMRSSGYRTGSLAVVNLHPRSYHMMLCAELVQAE